MARSLREACDERCSLTATFSVCRSQDPDEQAAEYTSVPVEMNGEKFSIRHGSVVIAAITSCTNTSNPSVMLAAGLLARNAVERGLSSKPWVKTSLAPGSKVVTDYFKKAGVMEALQKLRFNVVGFGCTTCIGNSGPLPQPVAEAIEAKACCRRVLSGNRNFEGRINPLTRFNYLASPPLVVDMPSRVGWTSTSAPSARVGKMAGVPA